MHLHNWTPTYHSLALSSDYRQVYLKMEAHQPVGSYKIRGIGHLCQHYAAQGCSHFVCSSGGNAGVAAAYAGRLLGKPVTVFLPKTSKSIFIDAIIAQGASVHVVGDVWDEANEAARAYQQETQAAYIPPFNHPLLWAGHATMVEEMAANMPVKPEAIIVSVGGGGLICGVVEGCQRVGWEDVDIIAVETKGADSFAATIAANQLVSLPRITSIATSLGAKRVAEQLWQYHQQRPFTSVVVTDNEAVTACERFLNDHRLLVEPSSGASLAVAYSNRAECAQYRTVAVIVCGGIGISPALLAEFKQLGYT